LATLDFNSYDYLAHACGFDEFAVCLYRERRVGEAALNSVWDGGVTFQLNITAQKRGFRASFFM
jgi:hypothetical protein